MRATFNRTFLKELAAIPAKTRVKVEQLVFKDILTYSSHSDIPSVKKLKGYVHYYRIRIGDYRIGVIIKNDEISFERILHRKEIYRRFP